VVKVIWKKAASPPHTDCSVVFAMRRQCVSHLTYGFLDHPTQHPKLHLNRYSCFRTPHGKESQLQCAATFPPQNCPLDPHLIHSSLGPPESTAQTASRMVQPCFAGLTIMTDKLTDFCNNRLHLHSIVMQPKTKNNAAFVRLTVATGKERLMSSWNVRAGRRCSNEKMYSRVNKYQISDHLI